jgi:hypothetical protein
MLGEPVSRARTLRIVLVVVGALTVLVTIALAFEEEGSSDAPWGALVSGTGQPAKPAEQNLRDLAFRERLALPPETLGVVSTEPLTKIGSIQTLVVDKVATKPKFRILEWHLNVEPNRCYYLVSTAPDGTELHATIGLGATAVEQSDNLNAKAVSITSACTIRSERLTIIYVTTKPGPVAYQLYSEPNPMRAEMEADLQRARRNCLRGCDREFAQCGHAPSGCRDNLILCRKACGR